MNIKISNIAPPQVVLEKWNMTKPLIGVWFYLFDDLVNWAGYAGLFPYMDKTWFGPCEVFEEYRGKNYQSALLQARVIYAKRRMNNNIITKIRNNNLPSIKNCVDLGFKKTVPFNSQETFYELQL